MFFFLTDRPGHLLEVKGMGLMTQLLRGVEDESVVFGDSWSGCEGQGGVQDGSSVCGSDD